MSIEAGYSRYTCARCGTVADLKTNSPESSAWQQVARTPVDKATTTSPNIVYTLCSKCYNAYVPFARQQDNAFVDFMAQAARDQAAAQAQADADAKAKAEQEKAARQKEIDDAVTAAVEKAKAEQKAEDEKTMIKVPDTPTVTPTPGTGSDSGTVTDNPTDGTDKTGSTGTEIGENASDSEKEND